MDKTLQKAPFFKRLLALMLDWMFIVIIIFTCVIPMSFLLKVDEYSEKFDQYYSEYEKKYGVDFDLTEEQFNAMTEEELKLYEEAYNALTSDEEANKAHDALFKRMLGSIELAILAGYLVMDVLFPLMLKNGQTLGKRVFGLAVRRANGEPTNMITILSRTVVGKFTVETAIPALVICSVLMGSLNLFGVLYVVAILVANIVLLIKKNKVLHDILADTMVVAVPAPTSRAKKEEPSFAHKAKIATAKIEPRQ